nr:hypothetical protein PJ912_12415 [Pectobacterium colocasium]
MRGGKNGISYPQLDGFFSRYRQEVHQTGEFLTTIENLIQEKVIVIDAKMTVIKGPNWKEPKFVTEKKYGIV